MSDLIISRINSLILFSLVSVVSFSTCFCWPPWLHTLHLLSSCQNVFFPRGSWIVNAAGSSLETGVFHLFRWFVLIFFLLKIKWEKELRMNNVPKSTTVHMTQMHFVVTTVSSKTVKTNSLRTMKYSIQYSLLSTIALWCLYNCAS